MEVNKISFSELKVWKECAYKHKLSYKDKIPHFLGNEYTAFGTAVHLVCEEILLDRAKIKKAEEIFTSSFNEEIDSLIEKKVPLREKLLAELQSQFLKIYPDILPSIDNYFGPFEVISQEEEILEDIKEFDSKNKKFKGFIDLVIKTEDDKYHVIDWKTCSWGWNSKKKSDPMTTYQLIYYKNYFSKKHNIDPENIEVHFALLKRTAKQNHVEFFRTSSGQKKINNSLKLLENAVINIEKENFIKNRLSCRNCAFYKTEHCT